ncbi:hypothetical protein [Paenibacillus koleovorans]|uniref:hypothetical protein n=1 Tax=Paenibacillus koleovorans TaxID=121608 RepID=UPI000FD740F2|nr:hypothetical protein [Paenibacillus koleovorans]
MKGFYRLLLVALVSLVIAFGVSGLPRLDSSSRQMAEEEMAVQSGSVKLLTDRNVVDLLVRQPLFLDIGHVEWSDSILSIDLKAKQGHVDPDFVYRDLYTLSKLGLQGTKNVKQLLVRVMELPASATAIGAGKPQLLVAMEARRDDLKREDALNATPGSINAEQYVSSHFRLTFTPKWLDRKSP